MGVGAGVGWTRRVTLGVCVYMSNPQTIRCNASVLSFPTKSAATQGDSQRGAIPASILQRPPFGNAAKSGRGLHFQCPSQVHGVVAPTVGVKDGGGQPTIHLRSTRPQPTSHRTGVPKGQPATEGRGSSVHEELNGYVTRDRVGPEMRASQHEVGWASPARASTTRSRRRTTSRRRESM